MYTLICPTRFKSLCVSLLAGLVLGACSTSPSNTSNTQPAPPPPAPQSTPRNDTVPSVVIKGKTAAAIFDSIIKFRTQKGMKVTRRDSKHVELSMPIPKSAPPAEAMMIYSISPANDGLRLSAQVFQIVRHPGKTQTSDITASLRNKLEEELLGYAR